MDSTTAYLLIMIASILVVLWLAYLSWQRRETSGAVTFSILMLAVAGWALLYTLELISGDLGVTLTWYKLRYVISTLIPLIWFVFTLQYSGQSQWLTPRPITLISASHLAIIITILTNDWHNLLWSAPRLGSGGSLTPLIADFTALNTLVGLYVLAMMLVGVVMLLLAAQRAWRVYRFQTLSIVVAVGLLLLGDPLVDLLVGDPRSDFEAISPLLLMTFSTLVLAFGFLRLGILEIVPVAHETIIEHIPDSVVVVDMAHRIISGNAAFHRQFESGHVIGKDIHTIVHELTVDHLNAEDCYTQIQEIDHAGRHFELRIAPLDNWRGRITGQVLILRDITENKQAEQRYQALFNQAQDAITIETEDERIVDVNPAASRLFGYSRDELLRMRRDELQPFDPNHNGANSDNGERFETPVRLQDGTVRRVEISQAPIQDGGRTLYMSILRDVTEQKQSAEELEQRVHQLTIMRQLSEEISSTLDIDQVVILALDAAQRLSGASAGYIALQEDDGLQVVTMIGNYAPDFVLPASYGIYGRVIRSQEAELVMDVTQDIDYIAHLPETKAMMVLPLVKERFIGLITLETDKPERFYGDVFPFMQILASRVSVDIANARLYKHEQEQRQRVQELYHQVRRLEQLKTDMIRIAAHDLKNPILAITGHLELFQMDRDMLNEEHQSFVDTMQRAGKRMSRMVEDILSLERIEQMAKLDQGDMVLIELKTHVKQAIEEYSKQADEKSQTMRLVLQSDDEIHVRGDVMQLYEAMTNLINNAIKYTPTNGHINVHLEQENGLVTFCVSDTGIGIPDSQQDRLFRPFSRVQSEETAKIEGTGLGLHLVKNIIDRHQGEMIFESTYGEGSTFGFRLPVEM